MVTTFGIFFSLALFHFIYQSVISPTLRLYIRCKLFELRDELRRLKLNRGENVDDNLLGDIQESINLNLENLAFVDLSLIYETQKYLEKDTNLAKKVETRKKLLEHSDNKELKEIYKKNVELLAVTMLINSGGWVIYVIPVLIIAFTFSYIKNLVKKLVFVPEDVINQFVIKNEFVFS